MNRRHVASRARTESFWIVCVRACMHAFDSCWYTKFGHKVFDSCLMNATWWHNDFIVDFIWSCDDCACSTSMLILFVFVPFAPLRRYIDAQNIDSLWNSASMQRKNNIFIWLSIPNVKHVMPQILQVTSRMEQQRNENDLRRSKTMTNFLMGFWSSVMSSTQSNHKISRMPIFIVLVKGFKTQQFKMPKKNCVKPIHILI